MKQLLAYAQLVRLPNTFTALADILLGALATGFLSSRLFWCWDRLFATDQSNLATFAQELKSWCVLVCLAIGSTLLYWSGMVWNDYFDIDQDRLERPGRPLASGRVMLRTALFLAIGLMVAGVLFAVIADLLSESGRARSFPIAVLLMLSILMYDGVLKATWAGPIAMGLCRFFNILLGLSVVNLMPPFWGWLLAFIIGSYIGGVTWFARTEARRSNQSMLIAAAVVMLCSLVLALTMPALATDAQLWPRAPAPQPDSVALDRIGDAAVSQLFPYLFAAFGVFVGVAVLRAIRRPDPDRVQPAVKRAILGLIVLDALMASAFVGSVGLLLVVLLLPGMILGRWLYST